MRVVRGGSQARRTEGHTGRGWVRGCAGDATSMERCVAATMKLSEYNLSTTTQDRGDVSSRDDDGE